MNFVKTTIIGGLLFLVPVVALILVLAEVFEVMLQVAAPMADFIPLDMIGGIALANILAALIVLLLCFAAGLIARAGPAKKLADAVESAILQKIPGYSLVKGMTSSLAPEKAAHMRPVLVSLGYSSRVGLEMERIGEDRVAVYFPGSPNAWTGEVHIAKIDQIERLERPVTAVIEHAEQLGLGSHAMLCDPPDDAPAAEH